MAENLQQVNYSSDEKPKICPFLSGGGNLVNCERENCAIWTIRECALVRMSKQATKL